MPDLDIYTEPTTFVLGAGASKSYGFPLGSELKQLILDWPDADIVSSLGERKADADLIPDFKKALRYGDYGTIDYFLERKKRYRELGAYYIAKAIASREHHDRLFPQRELYADLFHMLDVENQSKSIPPISIVTFNYDRSLEFFLSLNPKYNCPDELVEHAQEKVGQIPIVHAHGSLGSLAEATYGEVGVNPISLAAAARRIKIISDRLEDSEDYHRAKKVLEAAHNIIFLGFGYNLDTLKTITADLDIQKKNIWGTSCNLQDDKKSATTLFFKNRITLGGNLDCSAFLQHLGIGRKNIKRIN